MRRPIRSRGEAGRRSARAFVSVVVVAVAMVGTALVGAAPPVGASTVAPTRSLYETGSSAAALEAQGRAAGRAGTQGLVILDFGRPGVDGTVSGTVDFSGGFISFASIASGLEGYLQGYFATAPIDLHLDLALGTNNSCGPGQPCGKVVCGCTFEPPNFAAWGAQQAAAVEQVQAQANALKSRSRFSDTITVLGGDDAEPAFDPEFQNTDNLLAGYAQAVRGYQPAMIDYGSAEPGYWSEAQLLQVTDGFRPDLAVPEIYSTTDVAAWSSLASFAKVHGRILTVFGLLTAAPAGLGPQAAYNGLVQSLRPITGQSSVRWRSNIGQG